MAEQVAKMEIKANLQCRRCFKKIKKILCEIPEVRDQIFDEKKNTVTIAVVSCSPENVRQKILCKGRCFVDSVKILPPPKPVEPKPPTKPEKPVPPVPAVPPVNVTAWVCVCPPCLKRGCGSSCPCSCHSGWPPMCADGCGRPADECRCWKPPLCRDGCGRPAHECRCWRPPLCPDGCGRPAPECRCRTPIYPRCCDRCNNENACSSWTPHGCDCGRPPVCTNAGYQCESSCSLM